MKQEAYEPSSGLGWIFFSAQHRDRVMQVLDLMAPPNTVDELGVGVVRDALADTLFPGITTIMTRAKYFIIVPRILNELVHHGKADGKLAMQLRNAENEVMQLLAEAHDYQEELGIMGITYAKQNRSLPERRKQELARKPSTIYWNGIRTFGLYRRTGSLANLLSELERGDKAYYTGVEAQGDEVGDDSDTGYLERHQLFRLPDHASDWRDHLRIELTAEEARLLRDRIVTSQGHTLLGLLADNSEWAREFCALDGFDEVGQLSFADQLTLDVQRTIRVAQEFWTLMHGAHIRFNILLQLKAGSPDGVAEREREWQLWWKDLKQADLSGFDRELLWELTREQSQLWRRPMHFINSWIDLATAPLADTGAMDTLVREQEVNNKGKRSKLAAPPEEGRTYDAWVGISNMSYRFQQVKVILKDILQGMA